MTQEEILAKHVEIRRARTSALHAYEDAEDRFRTELRILQRNCPHSGVTRSDQTCRYCGYCAAPVDPY